MESIRIRDMGAMGIVSDISPVDLPNNAFSDGMNVRFSPELGVSRAPSFRVRRQLTPDFDTVPMGLYGLPTAGGADRLIVVNQRGQTEDWSGTGEATEILLEGFLSGMSNPGRPVLSRLYGNLIIHLPNFVPSYIGQSGDVRTALVGWPSDLRAASIRPFGDQLFAFNLTDGSGNRPRSARHSDFGRVRAALERCATEAAG